METDVFVELHVPDFQKAIDFYKTLGFEIVWISDNYMVMRKDRSVLNFYGGNDKVSHHSYFGKFPNDTKKGYAVEIVFLEDDVKEFYEKIKDKVKVVEPLKQKPWGRWDFRIEDPFGFYIRIGEKYDWINKKDKISKTKEIMQKKGLRN